jgi:ribosomal-protein-alanine N-acetyltransferase
MPPQSSSTGAIPRSPPGCPGRRIARSTRSWRISRAARAWESGTEHNWVITERPDERAIGSISFRPRDHAADFGYVLHRGWWGRGIATEAARAVVGWLFTRDEIHRVWATCDVENLRSARVLEKAGLVREGVVRSWGVRPNVSPLPCDMFMYARVREIA